MIIIFFHVLSKISIQKQSLTFFNVHCTGYLSRWVSWSGPPATNSQPSSGTVSPKGSPRGSPRETPLEGGIPISPQPPRPHAVRSRASSKASNMSEATPCVVRLNV